MAVDRIKEIFLAVDALPAQEHPAVGIKVIGLFVDRSKAGHSITACIKIVSITADLLELVGRIASVCVPVFIAFIKLDEFSSKHIALGKSSDGIGGRYCRCCLFHLAGDMIVQRIVKLIIDCIDKRSAGVVYVRGDRDHIPFACYTDMSCFDREGKHTIVTRTVNVAEFLEVVDRSLHPAAAEGGRRVSEPVVICKGRVHFFDKSGRVAGVATVVVELEDVRADIDAAGDDLVLHLFLNISAGEVGSVTGSDLRDQGVIVDVVGVIRAAFVGAAPEDVYLGVSDGKAGSLLEVDDRDAGIIGGLDDRVVSRKKILAVIGLGGAGLEVGRVRKV